MVVYGNLNQVLNGHLLVEADAESAHFVFDQHLDVDPKLAVLEAEWQISLRKKVVVVLFVCRWRVL